MRKPTALLAASLVLLLFLGGCGTPSAADGNTSEAPSSPMPEVWRLTVVRPPERLEYEEGDTFEPTGVVINATLSDGTLVEDVGYEGIIVNAPLTRTTLSARFVYGGKTVEQPISVTLKGNRAEYCVENTDVLPDSPLRGEVLFWLGSSVTEGASSGKESMVDFISKKHGALCIKEAVSGTTLADRADNSYVSRLDRYLQSEERAEKVDAFICQLSTNDRMYPDLFGVVTPEDVRDLSAFDTATTFGAMEYIIATARETWDCPVYFYTNPPMEDESYGVMVEALESIAGKWDVVIIDMYRDESFNDISEEERLLYMADKIHPSKAGYREWWLPKFEEALSGI